MDENPRRQTFGIDYWYSVVLFGRLSVQSLMLAIHGSAHTVSRKCVDVIGLGLIEERRHIAG